MVWDFTTSLDSSSESDNKTIVVLEFDVARTSIGGNLGETTTTIQDFTPDRRVAGHFIATKALVAHLLKSRRALHSSPLPPQPPLRSPRKVPTPLAPLKMVNVSLERGGLAKFSAIKKDKVDANSNVSQFETR